MRKKAKNYIKIDVMADGRFICTLRYPHCPVFKIDVEDIYNFVLSERPTLKGRKDVELWLENASSPIRSPQ